MVLVPCPALSGAQDHLWLTSELAKLVLGDFDVSHRYCWLLDELVRERAADMAGANPASAQLANCCSSRFCART
jgi:hypothetical protein